MDKHIKQIGFARLITDKATYAYLADVFILSEYRGQGLSKWLLNVIHDYSELQGIRRWYLQPEMHTVYISNLDGQDLQSRNQVGSCININQIFIKYNKAKIFLPAKRQE